MQENDFIAFNRVHLYMIKCNKVKITILLQKLAFIIPTYGKLIAFTITQLD